METYKYEDLFMSGSTSISSAVPLCALENIYNKKYYNTLILEALSKNVIYQMQITFESKPWQFETLLYALSLCKQLFNKSAYIKST